ncbi:MAG: hypothetical protein AAB410_00610 [Patescibacteria group bacterium]
MKVLIEAGTNLFLRIPQEHVNGALRPDESVSIHGKWFRVATIEGDVATLQVIAPATLDPFKWSENYSYIVEMPM